MKILLRAICYGLGLAIVASSIDVAQGQDDPGPCVETGALAYDNWTAVEAGGPGQLPTGVQSADYIRCKACHGWDRLGTSGGYVRRSRTAGRPNAGAGDGDSRSRALVTGAVTADLVRHARGGRGYAEGEESWVAMDESPSAANTAEHHAGYTLGNQHPDFAFDGRNWQAGVPSDEQIDCLVEFLNFEDGDPSRYFSRIDTTQNPVLYTLVETADAAAGQALFESACEACHTQQFAVDYVGGDGKFSELAHKVRWGIPDSSMTRVAMGNPTAEDVANLLLFLQAESGTGFYLNPGLTGTWWNADRAGEGFLLEFANRPGTSELTLFASFYSYDNVGNQAWLVAQPDPESDASGTKVDVNVLQVTGPTWGEGFDPGDRELFEWGSGTFEFYGCEAGRVTLSPGAEAQAQGYTIVAYDLSRDLLDSGIACPTPAQP